MSILDDLEKWVLGGSEIASEAAGTAAGGFYMTEPVTSPRTDRVKEKEIRDKVKNRLKGNVNALKLWQVDEDISDEEREAINKQIDSLSQIDRMRAELAYEDARQKESQNYINAARTHLANARAKYEVGEAGDEREREYRDAIDQETGVYTTGDYLGIANVVSNATEAYDYYKLTGESPAGALLGAIFKGVNRGNIREKLYSMSPEQRAAAMDEIAHRGADNSVLDIGYEDSLTFSEKILEDRYTNGDIAVDSAMSVLDLMFGLEINALTKGSVAAVAPLARRFAGFAREASKNKGFLKFLVSNESEKMAKEGINSSLGSSIIKQKKLEEKGSLSTIEQSELNSERAATRYAAEKDPEKFKKDLDLINAAEEYFGWKEGSAMNPVKGGVARGILKGSNLALKDSMLSSYLAADRFISSKIADGSLLVRLSFGGRIVDIDAPTMKVLREMSLTKEDFTVENISRYLKGDEAAAKKIFDTFSNDKTGFLYEENGKKYLARSEITELQSYIADVYNKPFTGASGNIYYSKSVADRLHDIATLHKNEEYRKLANRLLDNYGEYDLPYWKLPEGDMYQKSFGTYHFDRGIDLSEVAKDKSATFIHEAAHSTTADFLYSNSNIRFLDKANPSVIWFSPNKNSQYYDLISDLNKEFKDFLRGMKKVGIKPYGATNLHEFIATALEPNSFEREYHKTKGTLEKIEKLIDAIQKASLKGKHKNITGKNIFKPKELTVTKRELSLSDKEIQNTFEQAFKEREKRITEKLDGDWAKYFDRQNNNKPFNVIAQMNTSVDNSGVARAQAFKEAMDGEEYTSQGLDTAETLFADTMPSVGEDKAPMDRVEAFMQELQDSMVEIASETEREAIAKDYAEQLGKLNGSNVDISVSGTEAVVKCTFSGKGNSGYNSIQEARDALKELTDNLSNVGVREPEFKIVGADAKGSLETVQEGADYDKYYLQLEHRNDISHLFTGVGEAVDKAASIWDSTRLTRWIRDNVAKASTILPEQLLRPLMASFERREGFMASNFLKEATDFKKAFNKLDRKERANVFTLVYEQNLKALEANKKGEVFEGFTVVDLKGRGFSDEEISAISKLRDVQELSWHMKNLANARALSSLGYQAVPTTSRGRMIGKEADKWEIAKAAENGMLSVFDSSTGEVVEMSGRSLKDYKVFKFPTAYNGTTEYFITPLSTKAGAINWRFDQTIGRIPGYCEMRMKQGLIYIEENGKTVGVTDSVKKAEDYIGGRTDTFSWRLDRNVKEEKAGMSESTMNRRYGVELVNVDINDVFLNPLESMDAGIKAISSRTHVGPVIEYAKKDFVKVYGDVLSKSKYPESITEIRGNSEQANAARSMFNYIEKMSGVAEGLEIDSTYKAVLYRYGEKLGKIAYDNGGALGWIAEQGERALFSAARTDLLAWSRKVVSTAYIALNPIRQFFLQGVQLGNAYAVDPKSAHKLLMQVSSVLLSKTKLSHLPEEYQHFADLCERAGILTSQSSVGFISDAIDFAASMKGPVGRLFEYSAKGAMFGEKLQQMFHAAALYNKRVREFGKEWFNVRKNFDSWIEEVRIMSGSQSPVERMPWENGVLGAIFQFAQSPWKMNQLLFNKQLPKSMRAAILTNELLLFGAGTYGASLIYDNLLGEQFDQGVDEETREVIKDGLFGFSVNKLFGIKMDTENFAPTNYWDVVGFFGRAFGYNETEMATWMAGKWTKEEADKHEKRLQLDDSTTAEKAIELASVPTATFVKSRVAPIFRDIMSITGRGNPYDPKDIGDLVLDIGRMSSGFNQATKAYIAYTTGNYLNSRGAVLKEGLDGWAALGLLMGLNPEITKEERSKAFMETAWRDVEKIPVTTAYKSCLEYLNKTYGRVNNLGADENFKRDLEILKRLSVTWVNGDPDKQEQLDKYISKELIKAAKGHKSDAYVIGRWLTSNLKKNNQEFIASYNNLKKKDPERAKMVGVALATLANEKIDREE